MSLVSAVVDRVFREYLRPAGDYPLHAMLETTMTDSVTSVVYTTGYLEAEDEDLLVPGLRIEIGSELMQVTAVNTTTRTLTVIRGVEGTTAAAHTQDVDNVYFGPDYPRSVVAEAVYDEVPRLYPRLWQVRTEYAPRENGWEVTADAVKVLQYRYLDSNSIWRAGSVQLLTNMTDETATGNMVQFGVANGEDGYLTYKARFTRPTAETDDLGSTSFGIDAGWEQILVVGAAASVMAARDVDLASQEFITESLETQGFPVHSAERVSLALRRYRDQLLSDAEDRLQADYGARIVRNGLVSGAL